MPRHKTVVLHPEIAQWAETIKKPTTKETYSVSLNRLLASAKLEPNKLIKRAKEEWVKGDATTYSGLIQHAKSHYPQSVAYGMTCALRKYLLDHGMIALPQIKVGNPDRVKDRVDLKWEQAIRIADSASQPYALIIKLMLYSGWGVAQFLEFNTAKTWSNIKAPRALDGEYYRYDFKSRKSNQEPSYSLIPITILKEIIASEAPLPFVTQSGLPLDLTQYRISSYYLERAFNTAYRRSGIKIKQGVPTPHSLRSAFITRANTTHCDRNVAEFATHHTIDKLGYNRIYFDEPYMWSELKKIFGPTTASAEQVSALEQENKILREAVVSSLLPQKMNLQKILDEMVKVELRKRGLHAEGGLESLPPKYVTRAMREIDTQLENINQQLEALGWLKPVESVRTKFRR